MKKNSNLDLNVAIIALYTVDGAGMVQQIYQD